MLCLVLCATSLATARKRPAELQQMRDEVDALAIQADAAVAAPLTTEAERTAHERKLASARLEALRVERDRIEREMKNRKPDQK